jgi:hypothetical protein
MFTAPGDISTTSWAAAEAAAVTQFKYDQQRILGSSSSGSSSSTSSDTVQE